MAYYAPKNPRKFNITPDTNIYYVRYNNGQTIPVITLEDTKTNPHAEPLYRIARVNTAKPSEAVEVFAYLVSPGELYPSPEAARQAAKTAQQLRAARAWRLLNAPIQLARSPKKPGDVLSLK